ncbi:RLA class II histocompatibility antigen, DP alpha-1 chain-like isoform X2 [Hypanus sabinus]|uniref:RLA class II histocompatibility antigen, DP alpha-1 chain-like isoform X2 n=1 Tax=Hypanus sabinus TaxID=79690 RepID=UPI0028C48B9B|nr:RLA class II histocompatibility antigen, DP alpha-1 chain-like isoform X2 [Hypanus sabinus]
MDLVGFLMALLLPMATGEEIVFRSVSERLYYSHTPSSETNGHIFDMNTSPFLFYDYQYQMFFINGAETDGIKELGQDEVNHFKERASGIQAWEQGIIKEMMKFSNGSSVLKKKPTIHIYTEDDYAPGSSNTLYCYAENFYPNEIELSFLINGQPFTGPVRSSPLVVESDWTFNVYKYIDIEPKDGDTFSCRAAHLSLDGGLTVSLDLLPPVATSGIIVCAVGVIVGIIGLLVTLYLSRAMHKREVSEHCLLNLGV